jgi:hypothetical protein|tara:strand:+ start:495 stop:773 length:279 start_codon:yes stop_codon:yes gene_type:complete
MEVKLYIKGYGVSYSVGVDRFKNIYIPNFDSGFLYKVSPNLKDYEVFDIKQNQLIKIGKKKPQLFRLRFLKIKYQLSLKYFKNFFQCINQAN